ncbi:MAG: hypothetical protein MJ014_00225 [Methanocorpusculum sp.]|nr:hypothetical protein [Methanocorpusculum sp.]
MTEEECIEDERIIEFPAFCDENGTNFVIHKSLANSKYMFDFYFHVDHVVVEVRNVCWLAEVIGRVSIWYADIMKKFMANLAVATLREVEE